MTPKIHPSTFVHPTAVIGPNVTIDEDCYIGPFCIIGYPPEHKNHFHFEDKGVIICKGSILTGHVTVDAGITRKTFVGDKAFLMKHTHVGHDATLLTNVIMSPGAVVGGHCHIGNFTNLGINSSIHQWVEVPDCCMIGMGAVVIKNTQLESFGKYAGVPAKWIGDNRQHFSKGHE